MTGRRLTLLLALYVTLDLANPWMPGAFVFDPDGSVDGAHRSLATPQPPGGAGRVSRAPRPEVADPRSDAGPRLGTMAQSGWLVDLRQAHSPSSEPPPPDEDH